MKANHSLAAIGPLGLAVVLLPFGVLAQSSPESSAATVRQNSGNTTHASAATTTDRPYSTQSLPVSTTAASPLAAETALRQGKHRHHHWLGLLGFAGVFGLVGLRGKREPYDVDI
jgi:hypothetical protein